MEYNDLNTHVVKTSAQWNERAIEYWVVPRGCLCVELTPKGKTKIKVGEGNKNYYQLPYIGNSEELYNYYTKEEVDALLNNFNRMAIMSTEEYPSKRDLPTRGNKVGDVRFVTSPSPDIKPDPDLYVWDGRRWIFTGSPLVDMSEYVKTTEFNIVKNKVDQIFPMAHTHANKAVLDNITQEKLDEIDELAEMYDGVKTDITDLKSKSHTHSNKTVLDTVTQSSLMSTADRTKLDSLHNYDDTEVKGRLTVVESKAHTHDNKSVLDGITQEKLDEITELAATYIIVKQDITELKEKEHSHDNIDILNEIDAAYTLEQQNELVRLSNIGPFIGCGPTWHGILGYVPAPEMGCQNYFLRGDGTWALVKATGDKYKAGEGIYILSGEVTTQTFPFKLYAKGGYVKQYIIYGAPGGVGEWNATTQTYHIPIRVSAEGHTSIDTIIQVRDKLYEGDWINFETQEYSVYRTNLTSTLQQMMNPDRMSGIDTAGNYTNPPGYWPEFGLTDFYEIDPDARYEIPEHGDHWSYEYANVNMYDENKNRTRTILRSKTSKVQIIPMAGEKYMRIAWWVDFDWSQNPSPLIFRDPMLYQLKDTISPVPTPLQQIQLIPNAINTIDVLTTVKPLDMYVETVVPPDPDPDDPMSEYTGIIYNDGVLDITQEDPDALNELTVHFRDNVDKTLTIPTYDLEPATTTTLGGVIVGVGLSVDQYGEISVDEMTGADGTNAGTAGIVPAPGATDNTKFLRGDGTWAEVSGGGGSYRAGQGVIIEPSPSTLYTEIEYLKSTGTQYIKTDIISDIDDMTILDLKFGSKITDADTASWTELNIFGANKYYVKFANWSSNSRTAADFYLGFEWSESLRDYYINNPSNISTRQLMTIKRGNCTYGGKSCPANAAIAGVPAIPFCVFGWSQNSTTDVPYVGYEIYLYELKVIDSSNVLVHDLIPVKRNADNELGLYDLIGNKFYSNAGTGTFTTGSEVGPIPSDDKIISTKLGTGLTFDANDAIELDDSITIRFNCNNDPNEY